MAPAMCLIGSVSGHSQTVVAHSKTIRNERSAQIDANTGGIKNFRPAADPFPGGA